MSDPQSKFRDDQDLLKADLDKLFSNFIKPIDALRSHFNALVSGSQELNTPQYQESRLNAYYRMIGFPIVSTDGSSFYSPGFDPNLNTDTSSASTYQSIADSIKNDHDFVSHQLNPREKVFKTYRKVFSDDDNVAKAIMLGSLFPRSFEKQFSGTGPLEFDKDQVQTIDERNDTVGLFYGTDLLSLNIFDNQKVLNLLSSNHPLKPFVVDPRIDGSIRPIRNRICAPFLKDKSQTKIFQSSNGSSENLLRPFIERVISVRFNTKNVTTNPGKDLIASVIDTITNNGAITDSDLISITSNSLGALHNSELIVFNNYFKILRSIITRLSTSIKRVEYIRSKINFQPVPDPKNGPESGISGGNKLDALDPKDTNNLKIENDIVFLTQKKIIDELSLSLDAGLQGIVDSGDFTFSNLDDSVFSITKSVQKSYDSNIKKLTKIRNQLGNEGIEELKNIEIIMGEYSGIGLLDIIAIQSALWVMDPGKLLGLIDDRAFARAKKFRSNLTFSGVSRSSVIDALTDFEEKLKNIYLLMQDYFKSLNDGTAFNAQ
jgi:hypothetical protein